MPSSHGDWYGAWRLVLPRPELLQPTSIEDASEMLVAHGDEALAIAGGTAVVLVLRQRLISPRYLVDLDGLPGLADIEWDRQTGARIGALNTVRDVERASVLRAELPLLCETYATVGNVRVRNAATVGGNLAHGDYRLDPPAALLVLGARVVVTGPAGVRELSIGEFFRGFEETALERGDLITALAIPPVPAGGAGAYVKFNSLSAEDWPCVGVAALVRLSADDRVETLRLAVTAVNPVPLLVDDVGSLAVGRAPDDALISEIAALAAERVSPIADIRGSEWYRREVTAATVRDALARAIERAREIRSGAGP